MKKFLLKTFFLEIIFYLRGFEQNKVIKKIIIRKEIPKMHVLRNNSIINLN